MPDDVCSKMICGLGDSDLWRLQKMDDVCSKMICGEGESDLWRLQKIWHHDGSKMVCGKGEKCVETAVI